MRLVGESGSEDVEQYPGLDEDQQEWIERLHRSIEEGLLQVLVQGSEFAIATGSGVSASVVVSVHLSAALSACAAYLATAESNGVIVRPPLAQILDGFRQMLEAPKLTRERSADGSIGPVIVPN